MEGHKLVVTVFLATVMVLSMIPGAISAQGHNQDDDDDNDSGDASTITSNLQNDSGGYLRVVSNSEGHLQTLYIPTDQMLFDVAPIYDSQGNQTSYSLSLKPELENFYQEVGFYDKPKDTVFIYPSFTQAAYGPNGFYNYYRTPCDSICLTVQIPQRVNGFQASSIVAAWILKLLDYPYLMDQDVDKNPDILKQYKRVIVLHSEYVTQKEFDAITSHPDVIFLYPNALYARVQANYDNNTITLMRGHGYPNSSIRNGFGWRDDNTKYEYNVQCNDWNFYHKGNYTMLNSYPEYKILTNNVMLESLEGSDPTSLSNDVANWLMYPQDQNATEQMLNDFDVNGTIVPKWVEQPALWLANGDISKRDFGDLLQYLNQENIIK